MLKLKLQYFGHLMQRMDSLQKTLMLEKIKGRGRGQQSMRWLDSISDSRDMSLSKLWEVGDGQGRLAWCSPWGHKGSDTTEWLNCTESCASACASSSPAFRTMYSACKLNNQHNNIQPWHTPSPVWNQSDCYFLTCIQVFQEAGKVVCYSYLSKNFPVCCDPHSQRL